MLGMSDLQLDSNLMHDPLNEDDETTHLRNMLPFRGNITINIVGDVERDLEFYELVSLVFLLYDDVDLALQRLKMAEVAQRVGAPPTRLIFDWAERQNSSRVQGNWETKLLEAVCIIQNYSIARKLGYSKPLLDLHFLPRNEETSLYVDMMRKALYIIVCESLSREEGETLVNRVKTDLKDQFPVSLGQSEPAYLEMYILFWLSQRHISVESRGSVNLGNLTRHLKAMGRGDLMDRLESVSRCYETSESGLEDTPAASMPESGSGIDNPCQIDPTQYHIDPNNMGWCVIINQKNFYRSKVKELKHLLPTEKLDDRIGTDLDKDRLCEAFGNFGFKISTWSNLDHHELLNAIDHVVQKLVKESDSCLALCILSHGQEKEVFGVDSIPVSVDEIERRIQGKCCPQLLNKPKIMFIQACQGQKQQEALTYTVNEDIASDGSNRTCPVQTDSFVFWSTVAGYASFRNLRTGSWFIQALCDQLVKPRRETDIYRDLVISVNKCMKDASAPYDGKRRAMQPVAHVTLTKDLIFPCNSSARRSTARAVLKRHLFDALIEEYLKKKYRKNRCQSLGFSDVDSP